MNRIGANDGRVSWWQWPGQSPVGASTIHSALARVALGARSWTVEVAPVVRSTTVRTNSRFRNTTDAAIRSPGLITAANDRL